MRYPALTLALAGAAVLTGCSSLISLNPFVADGPTVSDPALVGTWKGSGSGDDKDLVVIQQKGATYTIHYSNGKSESTDFEGRLAKVGDAELMDIVSTADNTFAVPVHMVARIWTEPGTLKWVYLDSDWIKDQARQSLATQPSGDRTLIAAPGDAVVQFLKRVGADSRAYSGDPNVWVKLQ